MSKKIKIFLFLLFVANQGACANKAGLDEVFFHCRSEPISKEKIIVDDGFMANIIDNDLSLAGVNSNYVSANVDDFEIVNKHDPNIKDHVFIISSGENYFSYYKTIDRSFPLCVSVKTDDFEFKSGVNIGQPISVFKKKFKFEESVDVLIIQDLEGGNIVELRFDKKGRLERIILKAEYIG